MRSAPFCWRRWPLSNQKLRLPDDIDRNLHGRRRSPIFEPVCGVPVLRPSHARSILRRNTVSAVRDRSLQNINGAWSVYMVVKRTEYATRLDRHHAHAKLAPSHPFNLRAKVNRCKQLHRYPFCLRCHLFIVHRGLLAGLPAPKQQGGVEWRSAPVVMALATNRTSLNFSFSTQHRSTFAPFVYADLARLLTWLRPADHHACSANSTSAAPSLTCSPAA